jgi:PadR family transcriptional regulator, regulatory protein AphA
MSLPHALLGLLSYQPATGYDLKAAFTNSIGMFWDASLPQIYRTLNQMGENGLLSSSIEHQEGKPSRKIYELTDKGKSELREWLSKPPEFAQAKKNDMLLKLFFGSQMNQKDLADHFHKWRRSAAQMQEKLEKEIQPIVDHYGKKTGAKDDMRFWLLTADYGRRQARMMMEWCDAALEVIEKEKGSQ